VRNGGVLSLAFPKRASHVFPVDSIATSSNPDASDPSFASAIRSRKPENRPYFEDVLAF
jgi:hypothetical protein